MMNNADLLESSMQTLEVRADFLENQIATLKKVQEKHPHTDLSKQISRYETEILEVWESMKELLEEVPQEYYETYPEEWSVCPNCGSEQVYHETCGKKLADCICYEDDLLESYCFSCEVSSTVNVGIVYEVAKEMEAATLIPTTPQKPVPPLKSKGKTPTIPTKTCTHIMEKVTLNEEAALYVYCSGSRHILPKHVRERQLDTPTFGLYADRSWNELVRSRNEFINWPDFDIPMFPQLALTQIIEAFSSYVSNSNRDAKLEIGCIGGHGRTGTILACLFMFANPGMLPSEAIEKTRSLYCEHAIETYDQAVFIFETAKELLSIEDDTDPGKYASQWSNNAFMNSTCTEKEHHLMMLNGLTSCLKQDDCSFWDMDLESYLLSERDG